MEKLLELLQIYVIERQGREQFKLHGDKIILWRPYKLRKFPQYDTNAVIISKRFGFIQRLVENDKINKDLISRVLIRAYISPKNLVSLECEFHDYYESLLMLLSIQDEPLKLLISVLK